LAAGITRPRRRHVHGISQLVLAAGSAPATASAPLRTRESPHRGAAASPRARVIHPTPSHGRAPRPDGNGGAGLLYCGWGQRDESTRVAQHTRAPTWILSVRGDSLATVLVMCGTGSTLLGGWCRNGRSSGWMACGDRLLSVLDCCQCLHVRSRRNAPHPSGSGAFCVGGALRSPSVRSAGLGMSSQ